MPAPRTSAPSTTTGSDALLYLLFGVLGVGIAFGSLAWLTGNLTNALVGTGRWAPFEATNALLHPDALWPHLSHTALLLGARLVPGLLSVCLTVIGLVVWLRLRGGAKNGLARRRDLAPLMNKEIAAKAKSLRPSLSGLKPKEVAPADRGILVGTHFPGRAEVRASWEDVIVAIMAPRSGKTSGLAIPAVLAAPGPVLLTSNKAANDAFTATVDARAKVGMIWTLDPQQIAHHPREMWWDILADARDLAGAKRLAGHFVAASVDESSGADFWSTAASNTLGALFLAAASHRRPITDVLAWLASPADRTPVDLLTDAGHEAVAAQLQGTVSGATETRDGIYETARQYASCLLDPDIAAWVTPDKRLPEFKPSAFATSRDTLYLLSKDGGGSASAIIAAAADAVMRAAVVVAERSGGRLDPPALCVLDEAANVCKISDLPDLYSHLGSRGVIPMTILQSYRQGQRCWGEAGMDALWSAATVKIVGSGIDDIDFADKLSRAIGEHEVQTVSVSRSDSGKSTSVSMRTERILAPDAIRALPKGKALLLATGLRIALLDLKPWYKEPSAKTIAPASAAATATITDRALAKANNSAFGRPA
ncbi:type IV secretory system conjugative DNA transfer family protein [Streptomyces caniscabiei]|uniref:TraM recognition domain-containing protein n=1 Tax=Streptomyces caniscabiei TaxID=2746961 RepID=A0ABU4MYR7_9ACTN|nr:type IV secretory system conjugative DNA transfer family protein [Streptomyces caniscabiei]MBE4741481.1 TraM recognition domain-containing protein [Streptomyces caniscabiei]MBE4761545.1 TraM recognition domain-containing protein [Streptomyces caniscabiei]MBE4790043.1 TraM recognition domain-containing protein [Streptomyces caniscabiei]MBE4799194.1 TraM recognition domain-containing protein [Streptomyces caniscabiei]MDX2947611.1 TraM recognition domain-containing protein [Streptomyces canisc